VIKERDLIRAYQQPLDRSTTTSWMNAVVEQHPIGDLFSR
jgi:hypothetical protein